MAPLRSTALANLAGRVQCSRDFHDIVGVMSIRCPSCTKLTLPGIVCGTCGCATIAPELYGVARLLAADDTPAHALPLAVAALDEAKLTALHLRWSVVHRAAQQIDELITDLSTLVSEPVTSQLRDELAAARFGDRELEACHALVAIVAPLPRSPAIVRIRAIADSAPWPWLRQASELAIIRVATQRAELAPAIHLLGDGSALDIETALAQFEWRTTALGGLPHSYQREDAWHIVERALHLESWAARAAAVLAARTPDHIDGYRTVLQAGLHNSDRYTQLACALVLGDEGILEAACADDDPVAKRAAQIRLAKAGSLRILRVMLDGTSAEKLTLLNDIQRSGGLTLEQLPALLRAMDTATDEEHLATFRLLRRRSNDYYSAEAIKRIAGYALTTTLADTLVLCKERLELLAWIAGDPSDANCRTSTDGIEALMAAVADSLLAINADEVGSIRFHDGLSQYLLLAERNNPTTAFVFERWLSEPTMAEVLLRRLLEVHDARTRRQKAGADVRTLSHVVALWERCTLREELVAALHLAVNNSRHLPEREVLVDWVWQRFCSRPNERAELYTAFAGWRNDLLERRNQLSRDERPGGESAAAHLQLWGSLDLERIQEVLTEAHDLADDDDWLSLTETAFGLIRQRLPRQQIMAMVGVCQLGHHMFNQWRLSESAHDGSPGLHHAVDRFEQYGHQLVGEMKRDGMLDPDFKRMLGNLTDLLTLFANRREERAEREREEQQRAQRDRDRAAQREAQQAEVARQVAAAHEEARRQQAEMMEMQARMQAEIQAQIAAQQAAAAQAAAAAMAAVQAAAAPPTIGRWAMPNPIEAVDFEALCPTLPLVNLVDYCRVLVRLQRGGNPATLFPEHSIDPTTFAQCSQQFSMLFTTRPQLAQRFAALMAATWI